MRKGTVAHVDHTKWALYSASLGRERYRAKNLYAPAISSARVMTAIGLLCRDVAPDARQRSAKRLVRLEHVGLCPQSKTTTEGVRVVARAAMWRQPIKLVDVASPDYRIVWL